MLRYLLQRPIAVSMTLFVSLALSLEPIPFLIGGQNEEIWFTLAVGPIGVLEQLLVTKEQKNCYQKC